MGVIRRCERGCGWCFQHLPLVFVYGLTTWAVWVEASLAWDWSKDSFSGYIYLFLGVTLYGLLNWSYTVACFTDPGSPLNSSPGYTNVPTEDPSDDMSSNSSFTVKASTGTARFCKKCQTKKPDRAHHCSTCRRCVLKMDHHCPWLATCVGLHNYKAFLLFCGYTTLFCWVCFGTAAAYMWVKMSSEDLAAGDPGLLSVNVVILSVLAGIFGLVLTGFTGWHISLAMRNQTTIECLEKTRYLSPIRRGMNAATQAFDTHPLLSGNGDDRGDDPDAAPRRTSFEGEARAFIHKYGQKVATAHANAIPGITRPEEGTDESEDRFYHPHPGTRYHPPSTTSSSSSSAPGSGPGSARASLRATLYADLEAQRERERYEEYLDERDSARLPHAFDLGWRRNLADLMGPSPALWLLPVCNSRGDGWRWEVSSRWRAERRRLGGERAREMEGLAAGNGGGNGGQVGLERVLEEEGEYEEDERGGRGFDEDAEEFSLRTLEGRTREGRRSSVDGMYARSSVDEDDERF